MEFQRTYASLTSQVWEWTELWRSEKTKIGRMVSAALVSTLVGMTASNMGIILYEAPAYSAVFNYLLPLTIPLLLFRANLRHVIRSTGPLLLAFFLGSGLFFAHISEIGLYPFAWLLKLIEVVVSFISSGEGTVWWKLIG